MANHFRFYKQRLKHASLAELCHRTRQTVVLRCLHVARRPIGSLLVKDALNLQSVDGLQIPEMTFETSDVANNLSDLLRAENILNPWGMDDDAIRRDIRIRWEPARLQQATSLVVFSNNSHNDTNMITAKRVAKAIVLGWIDKNPFPYGEHYSSAMECALRIPVLFYLAKCESNLNASEKKELLVSIYLHGLLISNHLSLYSSLGNHTVAEAVGLVFAGAVFKETKKGARWIETGVKLLGQELTHQILEDGGPAEQSFNYHRFVLDLYWLVFDFITRNHLENVDEWASHLVLGETFLNAFKDAKGGIPAFGDSDEGFAVAPGVKPRRMPGEYMTASYKIFMNAGYSVIRKEDVILSFDHGPLGMSPLYNHGHADALSITLSKGGYPFLVDAGTFRYNGVPQWRQYFKGTRAHNTVTIDGHDQAVQETSFVWSEPYNAKLLGVHDANGDLLLKAKHDGYRRLSGSVEHLRSVFCCSSACFLVKDHFSGEGKHRFEINYHFHPDVILSRQGMWWVAENGKTRLFIRLVEGNMTLIKGEVHPPFGWHAPRYGQKMATSVLTFEKTGNTRDVTFTSAIFMNLPSGENIDVL